MRGRSSVLAVALAALAGPAIALPATAPASPSSLPSAAPGAIRTLRVEDLEKQARERNPAIAAAEAALAARDAQMRNAGGPLASRSSRRPAPTSWPSASAWRSNSALSFFHTLANQRRVESRERLAKLAHEATEVTDQLWNVGAADTPDRLAIENEARVLDSDLAAARFDLEEIRTVLKAAVGDPAMELGPLDGDLVAELPKIDPVEWRQRLLRESPSLQMVRDEIGQDEAALAEARRKSARSLRRGTPRHAIWPGSARPAGAG
jgi:outer membrane protein TolC